MLLLRAVLLYLGNIYQVRFMIKKLISVVVFVLFLLKNAYANIIRDSEIEENIKKTLQKENFFIEKDFNCGETYRIEGNVVNFVDGSQTWKNKKYYERN